LNCFYNCFGVDVTTFLAAVSQLSDKTKETMSEIDTRSKTRKKSTEGVVQPVEVDAKRPAKRRAATFGVGLKASQKNEVEDRASETEETTLPPVSEDAVGKSSVGGTEVALESGSKVLTGSHAEDLSKRSGSRTGDDYPTISKGKQPEKSPKKTLGEENDQDLAEARKRSNKKIPKKAEILTVQEATKKAKGKNALEELEDDEDTVGDEETQGVLSPEPSEEDQEEIPTQPMVKRDHTRKELDKFKALRCVRLPLEEANS
jgi:hypothetical protein